MSGVLTAQLSVFWLNCPMDVLDVVPPDRGDLFEELMHIRRLGIAALGRRSYPALERAVVAADLFKHFSDNASFKKWLSETVFETTYSDVS